MPDLKPLLANSLLWRAREFASQRTETPSPLPTGFEHLDNLLYDKGWPRAALVEILCDTYGIGELRLMAQGLAKLSQDESRWIAWINPPFVPYAPALEAVGVDIDKILLIHPRNHKEALWASERALKSGTCSAVLAWLDESKLELPDLRRLQFSAKQGRTWASLFRPERAVEKPSSAELRLRVEPNPSDQGNRLTLSILKRRGGWAIEDIALVLGHAPVPYQRGAIGEQLSLWQQHQLPAGKAGQSTEAESMDAFAARERRYMAAPKHTPM